MSCFADCPRCGVPNSVQNSWSFTKGSYHLNDDLPEQIKQHIKEHPHVMCENCGCSFRIVEQTRLITEVE